MITTLLLPLFALAASDCIDIVPGKSIGQFKLGDNGPSGKVAGYPVTNDGLSENWRNAGPYGFYVEGIKVIGLTYDPPSANTCYSLNGKKLPLYKTWSALRKGFPHCKYEQRKGGNVVTCDGLSWHAGDPKTFPSEGLTFRAKVHSKTLHQHEVEENSGYVKSLLEKEWPYISEEKKCIDIVPAKSLGALKIGEMAPTEKLGEFSVKKVPQMAEWREAGPYTFRQDTEGKIIEITYDPPAPKNHCYSLNGKKLNRRETWKDLQKDFPLCKLEDNFGGTTLRCDGLVWQPGKLRKFPEKSDFAARVDTSTIHEEEVRQNTSHVKYLLKREWPYIDLDKQPKQSECVNIVPGKSLGPFKLGDREPTGTVAGFQVESVPQMEMWRKAGPYRIQVAEAKIITLSYDPPSSQYCYSLKGKKLPTIKNWEALRNAFPLCKFNANEGGHALVCKGMSWYAGGAKSASPDELSFQARVNTESEK